MIRAPKSNRVNDVAWAYMMAGMYMSMRDQSLTRAELEHDRLIRAVHVRHARAAHHNYLRYLRRARQCGAHHVA